MKTQHGVLLAALAAIPILAGCGSGLIPQQPTQITPEQAQDLRKSARDRALIRHDAERMAIRRQIDIFVGPDPTPVSDIRDRIDRSKVQFDIDLQIRREKRDDLFRWSRETGIVHGGLAPLSIVVRCIPGTDPTVARYYNYPNAGFLYNVLFLVGMFASCGFLSGWIGYGAGYAATWVSLPRSKKG